MKKWIVLILAGLVLSFPVLADDGVDGEDSMGYVGALVGGAVPLASTTTIGIMFGAEAGFNINEDFRAGGYFGYASNSMSGSGASASVSNIYLLGFLDFMYEGFYGGAMLGLQIISGGVSVTSSYFSASVSATTAGIAFGPRLGYDAYLTPEFSIGPQANLMIGLDSSASSILNALAVFKYHF